MFVPRASVEMTTAASAVRTGTALRPRPGSNAIRTPVTSEGRPPLRARAPAIAPGGGGHRQHRGDHSPDRAHHHGSGHGDGEELTPGHPQRPEDRVLGGLEEREA